MVVNGGQIDGRELGDLIARYGAFDGLVGCRERFARPATAGFAIQILRRSGVRFCPLERPSGVVAAIDKERP